MMLKYMPTWYIAAFREMWRWIAKETLKQKKFVIKYKYFEANPSKEWAKNSSCYLCDYAKHMKLKHGGITCDYCPIDWGARGCMGDIDNHNTAYINWMRCLGKVDDGWKNAAKYAKQISELPEKEVKNE